MARFQTNQRSSKAFARAAVLSPVGRSILLGPAVRPRHHSRRFVATVVAMLFFLGLGYLAGHEAESLAIGILAADLAFLVAVATWSAIAGADRSR